MVRNVYESNYQTTKIVTSDQVKGILKIKFRIDKKKGFWTSKIIFQKKNNLVLIDLNDMKCIWKS